MKTFAYALLLVAAFMGGALLAPPAPPPFEEFYTPEALRMKREFPKMSDLEILREFKGDAKKVFSPRTLAWMKDNDVLLGEATALAPPGDSGVKEFVGRVPQVKETRSPACDCACTCCKACSEKKTTCKCDVCKCCKACPGKAQKGGDP